MSADRRVLFFCVACLWLSACASPKPPEFALDDFVPAVPLAEPPRPLQIVEIPTVLALPGQLKPLPAVNDKTVASVDSQDPQERVAKANASARIEPSRDNFLNATQVWPYSPDALYQIYTSPERITDIALQEGEELISVSAGDTVRWIIGDTSSGEGGRQRVHILVKPSREDLKSNLVIHSNRRTYHLELTATPRTWMASVSWDYPIDRLAFLTRDNQRAEVAAPMAEGLELERLNFRYEISGDTPAWRPLRAFDDGEKVYVQFPTGIAQGEMPPLFVVGHQGEAQLVNYRVRSPYYVVDRLFSVGELRLGSKDDSSTVRISRVEPKVSARR